MNFKCSCGTIVVTGQIKKVDFKKKLLLDKKPKGTIIRNNSKNPEKWSFKCSKCQSEREK